MNTFNTFFKMLFSQKERRLIYDDKKPGDAGGSVEDLEAAGKKLRTTPITTDDPLKIDEYVIN